jgi:hypothetical protein
MSFLLYNTYKYTQELMTSKTQLQSKIQELEAELQSFKKQLNNYKEVTLETASVGDVLADGSIVLQKENGLALLVAPASTDALCEWSPEFSEVYQKLQKQGFTPSQWFVPTKEQLQLAYETIPEHFSSTIYWSSTERNISYAWGVYFTIGSPGYISKSFVYCVRAFRCVTY